MSYRSSLRHSQTEGSRLGLSQLYPSPSIVRAASSSTSVYSLFRPISRLRLHEETETQSLPILRSSNYMASRYSFQSRKKNFSKESQLSNEETKPAFKSSRNRTSETRSSEIQTKDSKTEIKNSLESLDVRNMNGSKNDKLNSVVNKHINQKSDSKSKEDESNQNVIKLKSDNGCHAENHEIETQTENSKSEGPNISSKIFVKNPLRRSAKNRKMIKRNKCQETEHEQSREDQDPLKFLEIKSAAQWKAISGRVSWKGNTERQDDLETERKERTKRRSRGRLTRGTGEGRERPVTICPPAVSDFPAVLRAEMTTLSQMRNVCWRVKPWTERKGRGLFTSLYGRGWGVDCDEVVPGLYIGDKAAISSTAFLSRQQITHVLNAAEGRDEGLIDLTAEDFQDCDIKYLGLPVWDSPLCNILPYLGLAADYINTVLTAGKRIMVSCQMGVSRSASCVIAYLMIHQDMTALDALRTIRRSRDCRPNDGFMEQLILLDTDLRQEPGERLISLATVRDKERLPRAWHFEFFTRPVTEEEVGTPLVHLGQECPLRLSGFSSINETPSYSNSVSRRSSRRETRFSRHGQSYHQDSRSRSCDILEETDDDLERSGDILEETDDDLERSCDILEETDDDLEACDKLDLQESSDLPVLERVKEIIAEPEETWRYSDKSDKADWSDWPTTVKPELIQPPPEADLLSLIKVSSAVQWKSISTKLDIDPSISPSHDHDEETTSKQVLSVCWQVKPWDWPKDSRLFTSLYGSGWGCDCDEVVPGLFIGDKQTVYNKQFLRKLGVTHVLNAAEGPWEDFGFVNLNRDYYKDTDIHYQGFCLWDSLGSLISDYFGPAAQYIHTALEGGGKVVINCQMGVSRSSVLAMSYMILVRHWSLLDVVREFRKRRDVRPNDDFIDQIVCLHREFRRSKVSCVKSQKRLSDLPGLARPWHYEYWRSPPDLAQLPFTLRHLGHPENEDLNNIAQLNTDIVPLDITDTLTEIPTTTTAETDTKSFNYKHILLASADPFKVVSDNSESEWEYYTDTESESET